MNRPAAALLALCAAFTGCMGPAPGVLFDPKRDYPREPEPAAERPRYSAVPAGWSTASPSHKWRYIVIHHSATDVGSASRFDAEHRARIDYANGLGYHFVIGNGSDTTDGRIEVGPRWRRQMRGAHCGVDLYNRYGIGVCLVGNFERHAPSSRQMAALGRLVRHLQTRYDIPTNAVICHRHIKNTLCPGRYFPYRDLIASLGGPGGPGGSQGAYTYLGK